MREHPGWAYSDRWPSVYGGIEFKVDDERDSIIAECGSTLLTEKTQESGNHKRGGDFAVFEIQHSTASQWLAAAPRYGATIANLPKRGVIRVDWTGHSTEVKRKQEALDRLRLGKAAFASLHTLLPEGPKNEDLPAELKPKLRNAGDRAPYDEEQMQAIAKALVPGSFTSIWGPPGTGKTSVIAEITVQNSCSKASGYSSPRSRIWL